MRLASEAIANRIGPKRPIWSVSAHLRALGSPRIDDRRPPRVRGRVRIAFQHSLDEEPRDTEANRDGRRVLAPSRPLPDVAGEAYGFLPGTAHVELAAGGAPALSTASDRGQRPTSNSERGRPD